MGGAPRPGRESSDSGRDALLSVRGFSALKAKTKKENGKKLVDVLFQAKAAEKDEMLWNVKRNVRNTDFLLNRGGERALIPKPHSQQDKKKKKNTKKEKKKKKKKNNTNKKEKTKKKKKKHPKTNTRSGQAK